MPNQNDPKTWTPDYAWSLIDQVLLKARLQLIDGDMREKLADAKDRVWVESVKKGNAGYAPREYLLEEQLAAEEWAERQVQAALATWQVQGYEPCLAFWHAVNTNLLGPLFESRTNAASAEMELRDRPLNRGGSDASVRKYTLKMIGLQSEWRKKTEIFGREANYTLESKRKAEAEGARRLLLAEAAANPTQGPARRPPKAGTLSPFERKKRSIIFGALQGNLEGEGYCKHLDAKGLPIPSKWSADGCPRTYSSAYYEPKWRQRIQGEKTRFRRKYDNTSRDERERIITESSRHYPH